ncbi:MAG TPA: hypothetical protein EYQ50_20285 [Verrucomicrobiales bacterium]|nr:hypothetical protein [Verrucomicrobiales bacterium]
MVLFQGSVKYWATLCVLMANGFIVHEIQANEPTVLINEIVANNTARRVARTESGTARVGHGPAWFAPDFDDTHWIARLLPINDSAKESTADPLGFDKPPPTEWQSIYLRTQFSLNRETFQSPPELVLKIRYRDGFAAYINGIEVARRGLGSPGAMVYHDQPATQPHFSDLTESIPLSGATSFLKEGQNVLSFQLHRASGETGSLFIDADLLTTTPLESSILPPTSVWRFQAGIHEPSGGLRDDNLSGPDKDKFLDWIELHNPTDDDIALNGWSLTDQSDHSKRWFFPDIPIESGQYMVVLASGMNRRDPRFPLHTDFRLKASGEYLALLNNDDPPEAVSQIGLNPPAQSAFYSYGLHDTTQLYTFLSPSTPGRSNRDAKSYNPAPEQPTAQLPSGLYQEPITLTLTSSSQARIFYTFDGSEPSRQNGTRYDQPILISQNTALRAKAFLDDSLASTTLVEDYFIVNTPSRISWTRLQPTEFESKSGLMEGTLLDDGSIRTHGILPETDTFTVSSLIGARTIQAVRLDAIHDPALPRQGPGYHDFGNFVLTEFQMQVNLKPVGSTWTTIAFSAAFSDYSQPQWLVRQAIDQNPQTGWAIHPRSGQNHYAVFLLNKPLEITSGARIRFQLSHDFGQSALLGRFKLSVTDDSNAVETNEQHLPDVITQGLPILAINADPRSSLFHPNGIFAIQGGRFKFNDAFRNSIWTPEQPEDYNFMLQRGRAFERNASLRRLNPNETSGTRMNIGLRVAGSTTSRLRYPDPSSSNWIYNRQSMMRMNLYFRGDYGPTEWDHPLRPSNQSIEYDTLRLNPVKDPLHHHSVTDEMTRRLWLSCGHPGLRGEFFNLFINGNFKGYYSLIERPTDLLFNQLNNTDAEWDIIRTFGVKSGDDQSWKELLAWTDSQRPKEEVWQAIRKRLDLVNFADYILMTDYVSLGDWPDNNWIVIRNRSQNGRFQFVIWDADASFAPCCVNRNNIDQVLLDPNVDETPIPRLYRTLLANKKFQTLLKDRIHKLFSDQGPLTAEAAGRIFRQIREEVFPITRHLYGVSAIGAGVSPLPDYETQFIADRHKIVLDQHRKRGWIPNAQPPTWRQVTDPEAFQDRLTLEGADPEGRIFFTLDGRDPIDIHGTISSSSYNSPVILPYSVPLKARTLIDGEWSALTESFLSVENQITPSIVVSELMYHSTIEEEPTAGSLEFVEILNVEPQTVYLGNALFTEGIQFQFPPDTVLDTGQTLILTNDPDLFEQIYAFQPFGRFQGRLSNGGETLTLIDQNNALLFSFRYDDKSPWPEAADGQGFSLTLMAPNRDSDLSDPTQWTTEGIPGGTPGSLDFTRHTRFADWIQAFFPDPRTDSGDLLPGGDPDADGVPNLLEYTLGLSAIRPEFRPNLFSVVVSTTKPELSIQYFRLTKTENLNIEWQQSEDLINWQSLPSSLWRFKEFKTPTGSPGISKIELSLTSKQTLRPGTVFFRMTVSLKQ